ncbi:MAG TPA: hypothetical protein VFZ48_02965 [Candidatus Saccharimonadales bacterium]
MLRETTRDFLIGVADRLGEFNQKARQEGRPVVMFVGWDYQSSHWLVDAR